MARLVLSIAAFAVTSTAILFSSGAEEEAGADFPTLSDPGVYPVVDDGTVAFSMFSRVDDFIPAQGSGRRGEGDYANFNDYFVTEYLTEKTNVQVEFESVGGESFIERLLLMFASEDPTDVVGVHCCLSKLLQTTYIAEGYIRPLADLIESHSLHYKARLARIDGLREFVTAHDGEIYMLGAIRSGDILEETYGNNTESMWINAEWLSHLGLDIPNDVYEFYDVMMAFKLLDANGNGDPYDEIPLAVLSGGATHELDGFLMNPFQHTTVSRSNIKRWFVDDGGIVTPAFTQPGYRDGLRYLAQMWQDELIDRELFTRHRLNEPEGGVATLGAVPRNWWANFTPNWDQYVALAPLDGPAGRQSATGIELFRPGPFFTGNDPQRAAIAMKYLDWWYSDEGQVISSLGEEGKWWKAAPPGSLGVDGRQADYVELPTPSEYLAKDGRRLLNYLPIWVRGGGRTFETTQDPFDLNGPYYYHRYHYLNKNVAEPFRRPEKHRLPQLYVDPKNVKDMTRLQEDIDTFVSQLVTEFITGHRDIEADWIWFQDELRRRGLDLLVDLWQRNYEASAYFVKYW